MMTTTLTDETMDIQVLEERWLLLVQKEHPRLHEAALRCYVEHDATPTAAALAEALGAGADGEGWRRALMALRLPPCHYAALCEAQDAVAQADMQWQNYQHEVRETRDRVAAIDDELVKLATYATLGEAEKAEVAERVQDLRAERRDVEVYQQTHLPRVGATLDQEKGE